MKFVHIADMHFDTSFSQLNSSELGNNRRMEQRKVLRKIIEYIKQNNVDYLFIAGDFYEHKYIRESTIEYINKLFQEIESTHIFISPGNHDPLVKNSFYNRFMWNKNVHIFGPKITFVEDRNVRIYGYGFDDFYYTNTDLNNLELDDKNKVNILVTHGTLNGTNNVDKQYNAISKNTLECIGFDYVALGHIHKSNYTGCENIVYPGSTISMGFDELGNHGMIVGEFTNKELRTEFIPLDDGEFKIVDVDISELESIETIAEKLNEMDINGNNYYEVYLTGTRNFEIDICELKKQLYRPNIIKVKDKSKIAINLDEIAKHNTLKGLFVREIISRLGSDEYDREIVEKALEIGLEIL